MNIREGWELECRIDYAMGMDEETPTWTQVVEHNADWYTNPGKRAQFDSFGWNINIDAVRAWEIPYGTEGERYWLHEPRGQRERGEPY